LLVSIIIDNHNYDRYLVAALDSALNQDYPDVEVIVVDDGSTDRSREILAGYRDRVTVILKEQGGQSSAFNVGVAAAHGDVIMLLDSDDLLYPHTVGCVVAAFEADPKAVWVQFRLEVIDENGRATGVIKPPAWSARRSGDLRASIIAFQFDIVRMATSGNAFSARALAEVLPVPEQVYAPSGTDWYLCPLIGLFGTTAFLDLVGGAYRVHGNNRNWQERIAGRLDLRGVRRDLRLCTYGARAIRDAARRLRLDAPDDVLSVAYMADRMVSLKLEPAMHPIKDDHLRTVLRLGATAAHRRFDVRWPMRALFIMWFVLMAVAPRPVAWTLAELFFFPSKRGPLNSLLARLHVTAQPSRS